MWCAQCQYLTLLSVEIHVATRSDLRPDPEFDEIRALFYSLHVDRPATTADSVTVSRDVDSDGVIVVSSDNQRLLNVTGVSGNLTVTYVNSEIELLSALVSLVTQYVCFDDYTSSSRMRVMNHNWSATKQCLHLQSVAEISRHSAFSRDGIRQCETSSGSRHKDTDQCL